ncbi:hypothetical protein ACFMQL_33315 [Nonomuraea fastidiosa]|uniref:hypothetical protein n=1 Tax=Nonomuraea TaxID=83681 RepID=UPI00342E3E58
METIPIAPGEPQKPPSPPSATTPNACAGCAAPNLPTGAAGELFAAAYGLPSLEGLVDAVIDVQRDTIEQVARLAAARIQQARRPLLEWGSTLLGDAEFAAATTALRRVLDRA